MSASLPEPVPVIVVCGFLGAGKTTLLRRVLSDPQGVRYGVLVNDFGAIDIDGALIAQSGADQVSLSNGCVCCTIRDDLSEALESLLTRSPAPERIIVETSGVSRPLPVADAIAERFHGRATLDGIYCLIDAAGFGELDYAATELAMDQAVGADLVVLNKTDLANAAQIASVTASLRDAMPMIRLVSTRHADIPRTLLFSAGEGRERPFHAHDHDHAHDHGQEFEAWHWVSAGPVDEMRFRRAVRSLPVGILRAKGVVRVPERTGDRLVFHVVGKRAEFAFEPHPAARSAVVAIGRRSGFDPAALTALFEGCGVFIM